MKIIDLIELVASGEMSCAGALDILERLNISRRQFRAAYLAIRQAAKRRKELKK